MFFLQVGFDRRMIYMLPNGGNINFDRGMHIQKKIENYSEFVFIRNYKCESREFLVISLFANVPLFW